MNRFGEANVAGVIMKADTAPDGSYRKTKAAGAGAATTAAVAGGGLATVDHGYRKRYRLIAENDANQRLFNYDTLHSAKTHETARLAESTKKYNRSNMAAQKAVPKAARTMARGKRAVFAAPVAGGLVGLAAYKRSGPRSAAGT